MDTTARVEGVGCGENPGGRGREREKKKREVVKVRRLGRGDVSDVSGSEVRMGCGWTFFATSSPVLTGWFG
jgi:hypothetical protein